MTAELPVGWTTAAISDIAAVQGGIQKQPKRKPVANTFPFLRVANVPRGGLELSEIHHIELFDGELDRYRLETGDLLVVEGNGSPSEIGRAAVWDGSIEDCVHQNHLIRVRPLPGVDPAYLGHAWNAPQVVEHLMEVSSSTSGLHTLSCAKVNAVRLPLPPNREQMRIVAEVERRLSQLDAGVRSLQAARRKLPLARAAILHAATAGTGPEVKLRDVLSESMANGRSVKTQAGGFPVLRLTALRGGRIILSERKEGAWGALEAKPFLVHRDDFLVARGNGSLHLVGRGGLIEMEPDEVAYPDTLIRVRRDPTRIRSDYLRLIWDSPRVRSQIEGAARTTAGIYKVNQQILADIAFPLPAKLEAQDSIVADAYRRLSLLDAAERAVEANLARAEILRLSILRDAFAGRLVAQDSTDEPAEELLARMRAASTDTPRRRRRRTTASPEEGP